IPYIKVGRLVRYRKSALDAFLDLRTHGEEV
ncbi:DNA-binding protein, partial [Nitrosomonas oligotropha]|nr:DNA-binding protein [Nitrosomonas oligotropha]